MKGINIRPIHRRRQFIITNECYLITTGTFPFANEIVTSLDINKVGGTSLWSKEERKNILVEAYNFQYPVLKTSKTIKKMQEIADRMQK